ncbi:MAG: Gfo/Idh/MocA family oxidoreductase [Candidatus Neomarinimicrobiota bacterium]
MRTKYKIGIIGYGGFGQFLQHAWQSHEQVDVIAVADIQKPVIIPDKIKFYTDHYAIIKDPELDIIAVATPPDTHSQIAFAALEAGKHVLVEKPMALNIADAQEYKNRSRKANKTVMVNYMLRFNPIIMAVQALVNKGLFGELRRAAVENYAQDESLNPGHWFWDRSISGGILVEHGVHFFDLINSFTGSQPAIVTGYAHGRSKTQQDQVVTLVQYQSGLMATHYHQFSRPGFFEDTSVSLVFDLAQINIHGWIPLSGKIKMLIKSTNIKELSKIPNLSVTACIPIGEAQDNSRPEGWGEQAIKAESGQVISSGRTYEADTILEGEFSVNENKGQVYAASIRDLMTDFIRAVENPSYVPKITLEDGISSLAIALKANQKIQDN